MSKIFRHYKGKHYKLINDKAEMQETGQQVVVYESMTGVIYVRPLGDFYGMVVDNGEDMRRFEEVK